MAKVWAASGRTDDAAFQKLQRLNDEIRERKYFADDRPPAAPFEKNWQELSMKRMLRYAAENGYDRVAWTTGMQQAERYNIGGKVVRIAIDHSSYYPKFYNVFAYSPTGVIITNASHEGVSEEEVLKFYGNQIGEKLIQGCQEYDRLKALGEVDKSKSYVLDGVDMDFGGEGLTAFYDQILPNFANKYGKHWGVAVEDVALPTIGESMHSIPVTDQMKQDVREGQPMFFRNGERQAYGFVHNGTIYIDPRIATAETPIHEYTHLWAEVLRQRNPQEWQNIVQMMKATPEVWNNVRQNYPTLRTDDQIADEALAQFSGQRGYERLQEFAAVQSNGDTIFDKITEVLEEFWKGVAEFFGIHYTSKEQVADRILYDLLNEVNPLDFKIADPQGLREQQEALIESDHFKQWFGDWKGDPANASKVVDGRGRPLVVEHATNADFTIFDISHLGENSHDKGLFGAGFYFGTHTPGWLNDTKNVMQVYLDIKHPIEIDDHMLLDIYSVFKEKLDTPALRDMTITSTPDRQLTVGEYIDHIKAVDALIAENPTLVREMMAKDEELEFVHPRVRELVWREHEIINRTGFPLYMNWQAVILNQIGSEAFSAALKKDGYDGIIVDRGEAYKEYVAFDAAQIKSATNNVGLYSRENPDIRYHLAAEKEDMKLDYTSVIAASREVPERAAEPRQFTAEDREAGGALVDHLRSMGIPVHTDNRENRRVLKAAERDQSNVGKVRHFKTESGDSYGFAYKGQIHLDLRKIDTELPLHEYAHLWCDALRRINPDNWNSVVDMMKQDADTWQFVKTSYPELTSDNDLAEEVIAHYSGKRGAQKLQEELERMTPKDDNYSSRWGNVFQNVAKAVQDFWKHIGDSLNYQYSSKEDLADQILNDFAKNVNPVKKVERWLMERDKEYARAVESGDMDLAAKIFEEALQENIGNSVTPFVAVDGYRGKLDRLARAVKQEGNIAAINEAADLMAPFVPAGGVLVPAPSHEGHATDILHLANAIAERTGSPVADVLKGEPRESQRDYKRLHSGKSLSADMLGIRKEGELPEGKLPVVIDNVVNTGNTAEACVKALGKGMVLSLASAASQERHMVSLKSARPVVYDKEGRLIPLSERFELKNKWLGHLMNYKPLDASAPLPVVKEPAVVQGFEDYSVDFIKQIAVNRIEEILAESGLDDEITIKAVSVIGSRSRGEAHEGSDLDILMEYEGDYREDAMFDLLHENDLNINGISIDINPINPRYSMDTAHWLAQDARWREEDNNKNNIKKQENMATSDQLQTLLTDLLPVNGRIELPRSIGLDQPMSVGSVDMNVKYILRADDGFRISDGEYSLPVSSIPGHQLGDFVKLVEEYAANSVDKKLENARPATLSEDGETVSVRLSDDTDEKYTRIHGGTHDDPALIYSNTHVDVFFYDSVKNTIESIDNEVGIDAYENRDGIFLVRSAEYEKAYQQLEEHDRVIAAEKSQTTFINESVTINKQYNINSQQFFAPIYGATFTMGAPAPQQPQQSINIAEQFKYVSNLTEELGLEYVPYSMDKPITVRATTDVDWLDEDKVFTEVMCDGDNITIYENSQDSYDDKDGVHLSDLPSRIGMQVLSQMKEILTDDNRQMTVYVDTAHVPEYAIPAIINGDVTGLTEEEVEKVREFASQYPNCIFSVRDGGASYYERPAFGQATTCEDVDIVRVATPKLLRRDVIDKQLDAVASHEEVLEPQAAVEKPAEKTGSKWDNLDYTQYVLPEGADVTNKRVFRIPPKDGEKFPTYHIAADFKGVHYDRVMYNNDRRAFFEIDEQTGQRTNRASLDQLVAKYFGKQFAASMSIGSVQEAEHVLAEQNEAKEQAVSNKEQQMQEHEEKEQEAARQAAEKKAAEEAVQKKAEEARKAEKNDKTPVVVLQSMMVIDALHAAKENHGIWMNKEGKAAPVLLYSKTPVSAFNGLMMALHADANGYKSNNYVTFDGIKSEGCFIKKNEHGMKFNWYNWDKYVNRFNANDVIDKAAYEALAPEEKELYKVMSYKVERSIFNIDQSSMSEMKADDYKAYLAAQDTECLYRSGEALDHGTADYLRQYNELKAKHPDCILLFRADSSYNLYGEDVEKIRGLLGLHVEDHDPKGNETKYAVFPNSALDTYLPKMIRAGHRVAICDQLDTVNSQNNHLADAVYNKAAVLEDALVKLSGDSNRVMKEPFFDTAYNAADDTLRFTDRRRSNPGSEITTAIRRVNDSFRAAAAYTGGESRLNRAANSSMLPADAEKYDLLVSELAAGVLMSRAGLPATLSKESMETIPYWERELKESPKLMESIERDVNNAVDVLEKIKAGERIDYSAIRGKKAFDAIRPKLYTIANELSAIPDATDKHVVVVKDQQNKSAAVILPAGASLEVNNEIPGMNKNRFIIALRKQGFENVSFYNAGGALGLNQSNAFFADKTVEVAKLKQYELHVVEQLDLSKEIERSLKADLKQVQITFDDNKRPVLFVKSVDGDAFTVYPEPADVKLFFSSVRSPEFDTVRENIGQKYYGLVLRHPDLKTDALMPKANSDIDLSRITKVCVTKDRYSEDGRIIFATIDGKRQGPVQVSKAQAERMWVVEDPDLYRRLLAAVKFEEKLTLGSGQSEDGQGRFRDGHEEPSVDSSSPSAEGTEEDREEKQERKGGIRM